MVHDGVVFKGPSVLPPIEKWHNGMGKFSMHKNGMGAFLVCLFPALKVYVHALRRERWRWSDEFHSRNLGLRGFLREG